jgi:branched-chain amino acid transport system ATP-binding protein
VTRPAPILSVEKLTAGYNVAPVIRDATLHVGKGEAVALLGANGAGKTTLLRAVSGLIRPMSGAVVATGETVTGLSAEALVRKGVSHVAEGRRIFRKMSVEDNLAIGLAAMRLSRAESARRRDEQYALFPALAGKAGASAGSLSGGQQQMLAIAQALIREPEILMLDEPSIGLAPIMIEEVFDKLGKIRASGVSILLVEQVVERALKFVDYGYLLQGGRIRAEGAPSDLAGADIVHRAYMGEAAIPGAAR